jgi:hypothetical protein
MGWEIPIEVAPNFSNYISFYLKFEIYNLKFEKYEEAKKQSSSNPIKPNGTFQNSMALYLSSLIKSQ